MRKKKAREAAPFLKSIKKAWMNASETD